MHRQARTVDYALQKVSQQNFMTIS